VFIGDAQRNHDDGIDHDHDADHCNREKDDHAPRLLAREFLMGEEIQRGIPRFILTRWSANSGRPSQARIK
jgi:hypothetical protein